MWSPDRTAARAATAASSGIGAGGSASGVGGTAIGVTEEPGRPLLDTLTDALRSLAAAGRVRGVVFEGRRYDTGDRLDYLRTVVRLACEREDLGPAFREWLADFAQGLAP